MKKCYICKKLIKAGLKARYDGEYSYAHETCFVANSKIKLFAKNVPHYSSTAASGMSQDDRDKIISKNIIGEIGEIGDIDE